MKTQILTANDLLSGGVVFLSTEGNWSSTISDAWISDNSESVELFESLGRRAEKKQLVVGAFLIDIKIENGSPQPIRFREQLRVNGPSLNVEFNKSIVRDVA